MTVERLSRAWIFVSHSVKDIEGVRKIRDELEKRGAEPLLFFLKALEDHEELRSLLRREIEARHHFLLCDSPAARESRWVQEEYEFVRSLGGKRITTVSLTDNEEEQRARLDELLKEASVYLSFASPDRPRVRPYADLLIGHDFAAWDASQLHAGQDWQVAIEAGLRKAAEDGYLIAFLSVASLTTRWVAHEIAAFQQLAGGASGRLIMVDLEPVDHLLPAQLQAVQRLRFYSQSDAANEHALLVAMGLT